MDDIIRDVEEEEGKRVVINIEEEEDDIKYNWLLVCAVFLPYHVVCPVAI